MDKLNKVKTTLKGKLTRIENFAKEFIESSTSDFELSAKLDTLQEIKQKFEELQDEYFNLPTTMADVEEDLQSIDSRIEQMKVSLTILSNKGNVKNSSTQNIVESNIKSEINVKLPEISLPKFDGKYDNWNLFKSQFDNLITNNKQLTENQKSFYLYSCLIGDAKQIESKHDSFLSLLNALEDRYHNKRAIVDSHLNAIMNYEKIQHESSKELRSLLDCVNKNLRSLKLLDYECNNLSEVMLTNIILRKVDRDTRKLFELSLENKEIPSLESVLSFIEKRSFVLENINRNMNPNLKSKNFASYKSKALIINSNDKCILCKSQHHLSKCTSFKSLDHKKRYEFIRNNKLCLNCFSRFHMVAQCKSRNCLRCNSKHNTTLCRKNVSSSEAVKSSDSQTLCRAGSDENILASNKQNESSELSERENNSIECSNQSFQSLASVINKKSNILLSTAVIYLTDKNGDRIKCRAILDNGSQINLLTIELANILGLKKEKIYAPITGINGHVHTVKNKVLGTISNFDETFKRSLDFLVVPKITDLTPATNLDISEINIPFAQLADPDFFKSHKIDMLLGVELFFDIIKAKTQKLSDTLLLKDSVFGYLVAGSLPIQQTQHYCFLAKNDNNLEQAIERFWDIESVEEKNPIPSPELKYCDEHFKHTHYRQNDGRYVVSMPFKEKVLDAFPLGDSKLLASSRLEQLYKRLDRDPKMKLLYSNFMQEYEELGHMIEVTNNTVKSNFEYFLPHHGVYKPQSSSTKLRVVYNASAKTTSGLSLNDILLKGGVIQDDLFSIMTRFRKHTYAFSVDIEKMFRQILIHPDQTCLQKILWKKSKDDIVRVYDLQTVTYGTACAPYLATRTLQQLAVDEKNNFPLAVAAISDFYMDDCLSGSSDLQEAKNLRKELIELLSCAGMSLHKWCSNHPDLQTENLGIYPFDHSSDEKPVKTLGMLWNAASDSFSYKVTISPDTVFTKRSVLSEIARIYDPLGLIGPVISKAKIFMQKLWLLKISWQDILPQSVAQEWQLFISFLPLLEDLRIPRCVLSEHPKEIIMHGFADASESAYAAVIYLQSVSKDGSFKSSLICSKSRVAPLKTMTIPRLELSACLLLTKLIHKCLKSFKLDIAKVLLWSDSTIALTWIRSSPHLLKTFVSNRVVRIQQLSQTFHWGHVPSENNPADIISRGLNAQELLDNHMWWNGPNFLTESSENFVPSGDFNITDTLYLRELKPVTDTNLTLMNNNNFFDNIINRTNDFSKLIRIVSFIYRFIYNARHPGEKRTGNLTTLEFNEARNILIRYEQVKSFSREILDLKKCGQVAKNSKLRSLNPFLDDGQIIRVGGRLSRSCLGYNKKHPIILPPSEKITKLIFEYFHKRDLHSGPQSLLNSVRQIYWPLRGKGIARQIVHNCIQCFRAKPTVVKQIMGDLPPERINPNSTFVNSGLDFCGPFLIQYKKQRKGTYQKVYVAIFICMVTKAIHFEFVSDLTTEALIATLKRFFARRGKCETIFSDNAKNFVGANSELKRLQNLISKPNASLAAFLTSEGIAWKFLPPRAPNFGGLWEAGVKSFKFHLKRCIGNLKLTLEEFVTITTQIEGILNSRPLTPLSSEIENFDVLTPGHFLIGRPINSIPEPNLSEKNDNILSRWQKTSKIVHLIWKRWQKDYLSHLQQRHKWQFQKQNVCIGDMVLLKEDNLPPCKWAIGRIDEVVRGSDSNVRVVVVRTAYGKFKRPISKICILPIAN